MKACVELIFEWNWNNMIPLFKDIATYRMKVSSTWKGIPGFTAGGNHLSYLIFVQKIRFSSNVKIVVTDRITRKKEIAVLHFKNKEVRDIFLHWYEYNKETFVKYLLKKFIDELNNLHNLTEVYKQ